MDRVLPTGDLTFLFTDIEGSTRLLREMGTEAYSHALAEHRRIIRDACARHDGVEVGTEGDAFFVVFASPTTAWQGASTAQQALASGPFKVRMGIHTGTATLSEGDYVGPDVHLAARIAGAAHGGQVLVSGPVAARIPRESLVDLGEHRLKDFGTPVALFQLGHERFPPLRTISNTNLPRPASSLVGRESELGEVLSLLRSGQRLLTLTGPGGSGKTRLALEAASELVPEFRAGVFWVPLASLRDPEFVVPTIAHTLGAEDSLVDHIGERELLLVLDNLEQVVAAATKLAALVEACPRLQVIVTSRELLRVRGEVDFPVPPMADPEAVALFSARSGLEPDPAVADLCRALDNLPLAIELAAARATVLSPTQMLLRLSTRLDLLRGRRDADSRQQTLRAAIEWSYELLSPDEQDLFARLGVFHGGCSLEAAEGVARADVETLQGLVDKSLLRRRDDRFWMLETIRDFARERLEESGEANGIRGEHAEWLLDLTERAEPHMRHSEWEWLDLVEVEHDNLRAALDWLESSGDTRHLRLAGALWRFWYSRGHVAEGLGRIERALAAGRTRTSDRARALDGASSLALTAGDVASARPWAEEALAIHRELDDGPGIAEALFSLGLIAAEEGDLGTAESLFKETIERFEALGDSHFTLLASRLLGRVYYERGDLRTAREIHEGILSRALADGNRRMEAASLAALATIATAMENPHEAIGKLVESTRILRELGFGLHVEIALNLSRFARTLASMGRATEACRLLSASEAIHEEIGARTAQWVVKMNEETLAALGTHLDDSEIDKAWEEGRHLMVDDAVALAFECASAESAGTDSGGAVVG